MDSFNQIESIFNIVSYETDLTGRFSLFSLFNRFQDLAGVHVINEVPDKIQVPLKISQLFERTIWLSDIDVNNHVNNAQYAKSISDCFPENEFRERLLTSLQINFLEEILLGDQIHLYRGLNDTRAGEYLITGQSKNKGSTVFHARVIWERTNSNALR